MRTVSFYAFFLLWVFSAWSVTSPSELALVGGKIYPSPTEPVIEHGSILVRDGGIVAVGRTDAVRIPHDATVIDCKGLVLTAGFWNSHVHTLTPGLLHAENLSSQQISSQMEGMLTRWGFTTVFDIASVLQNTNLIRRRIESGGVKGPRIFTVGEPFWIKTPIYVKDFLETNHISMPEVESTSQAEVRVPQQIHDGADGIKIFANSVEAHEFLTMPLDLAKAIVAGAHAGGKPVFAHVFNNQGIEISIQSGVDILAHTTPVDSPWSPPLVQRMVSAHMALTPTLTLWEFQSKKASLGDLEEGMAKAAHQLEVFSQAGGQVLFGTDVGYTDWFDTSDEFKWMSRGGMNFQAILSSLTANPAQRFGYSDHSGHIAQGMDGDLVVLDASPSEDATAFSKVRYTIRAGKVIYSEK
jgi:imidazolonepropionase-like amidohydrolase